MQKKMDKKIVKKIALFALLETAIAVALVALDLILKSVAFQNIPLGKENPYLGGLLIFTAVKNTGASFGMFGSSTVVLTIMSLICSVLIYAFSIYTERTRTPLLRAALAFVLAGAVGNLIDRMFLGYVRDFIQLSFLPWVFNMADTYLTIGVALLLIYVIFFYSRDKERADKRKAVEKVGTAPTAEGLRQPEKPSGECVTEEFSVTGNDAGKASAVTKNIEEIVAVPLTEANGQAAAVAIKEKNCTEKAVVRSEAEGDAAKTSGTPKAKNSAEKAPVSPKSGSGAVKLKVTPKAKPGVTEVVVKSETNLIARSDGTDNTDGTAAESADGEK